MHFQQSYGHRLRLLSPHISRSCLLWWHVLCTNSHEAENMRAGEHRLDCCTNNIYSSDPTDLFCARFLGSLLGEALLIWFKVSWGIQLMSTSFWLEVPISTFCMGLLRFLDSRSWWRPTTTRSPRPARNMYIKIVSPSNPSSLSMTVTVWLKTASWNTLPCLRNRC